MKDLGQVEQYTAMSRIAEGLSKSSFCGVKNPADALWIIATGATLGLDPVTSLRGIHIIKGKPTLSADLMMAAALGHHACVRFVVTAMTKERAVVEVMREGWESPQEYDFTREDAIEAGLWGRGTWAAYPKDMLKARAISRAARAAFPDALMGVYVTGELDDVPPEGDRRTTIDVVEHPTAARPVDPVDYSESADWKKANAKFHALAASAQNEDGEVVDKSDVDMLREFVKMRQGVESWKHIPPSELSKVNEWLDEMSVTARHKKILDVTSKMPVHAGFEEVA